VSGEGLGQVSVTCDTPGFYARTVEDLDLVARLFRLDIEENSDLPLLSIRGARVAFIKTSVWPRAGYGTQAAWEQARLILHRNGAVIEDVDLPTPFNQCPAWRQTLVASETRSSFLPCRSSLILSWVEAPAHTSSITAYLKSREKLHQSLIETVESRHEPSRKDILEAQNGVAQLRCLWDELASNYDAIITPSVPDEAPGGLHNTGSSVSIALGRNIITLSISPEVCICVGLGSWPMDHK
jgi:amidase